MKYFKCQQTWKCIKNWSVAQNVSPNKHILAIKCVVTVGTFIFPDFRDPFCNCGRHIETFQITQIKENSFRQNQKHQTFFTEPAIVETVFGSNGFNEEESALIIESTIEYIIITEKLIAPLYWIHLSKSLLSLNLKYYLYKSLDGTWITLRNMFVLVFKWIYN